MADEVTLYIFSSHGMERTKDRRGIANRFVTADSYDRLARELAACRAENDRLRASLANSGGPCAYCSLPKAEWAKCQQGFPGCPRADDAMLCPHVGESLSAERELAAWKRAVADICTGQNKDCCGWPIGGSHEEPPECCGQPIDDASRVETRVAELMKEPGNGN